MKGLEFPVIGTKIKASGPKGLAPLQRSSSSGGRPGGFDLNSPDGRAAYFEAKAGAEKKAPKKKAEKKEKAGA